MLLAILNLKISITFITQQFLYKTFLVRNPIFKVGFIVCHSYFELVVI